MSRCHSCPADAEPGRRYCPGCREKHAAVQRELRARQIRLGLCRRNYCRHRPAPGRLYCPRHLADLRRYRATHRERTREAARTPSTGTTMTLGQLRAITNRALPCSPVVFVDAAGAEWRVAGTRRRQRTKVEVLEDGSEKQVPDGPPVLIVELVRAGEAPPMCACAAADAGS